MVIQRLARWSLGITMLFGVTTAVAQTNNPAAGAGGGKFRAACGEDVQRFCLAVQPGGGRVVQCLLSHTSELSAACENVIAAADRGGAKIRAVCNQDLQRFCVGVQPGGGRLAQWLSAHTGELSIACGNMIASIQARRGTPNASAQNPATQPAAPVTVGQPRVAIGTFLRASCGPDVQRLCAGARRESEVLKCLGSRRMELSATCGMYFQNLDARPTAQENTHTKKPQLPPTTAIPTVENAQNKRPASAPPATLIPD